MSLRLEPRSWLLVAVAGWAVGCALVSLAGFGGYAPSLPAEHHPPAAAPDLPGAATHAVLAPLDVYAQAWEHPLFFPDRKAANAHVPGKSADDHPLDALLTSVIITPTLRMAIVQDPKSHQSLRVRQGQPVGGVYGGWKLSDVQPRAATFESDSQGQATLDLRIFNGRGGPEPTRPGLTPQAVAAGAAAATETTPPPPVDAGSADSGRADAGGNPASDAASGGPSADAADSSAADQAAAQAVAEQQAEQIRRRIEERRRQALQQRQSTENDR